MEILVLGPVDVTGGATGAVEPSRRMAALGLLAYMASHDRPVTADQLAGALWPLDATRDNVAGPQRKTVMNVVSRARAVLGYGTGGHERLVHTPQGYRLSADVSSDWSRFERLVSDARSQPPQQAMAHLRRALELVRGEPFSGALSSQFFEWVASEHLDLCLLYTSPAQLPGHADRHHYAGHHYAGHWHAGHDGPDGRSGRWPGTNIRADSKRLGLRVLP